MADPATPAWQEKLPAWLRATSTPDRLRLRAIMAVCALIIIGGGAWANTNRLVNETKEVAENTGEVLIATQQVSASFAEADAAAVSVHLAGSEGNREQRRLYEQATERATASLERVARLVGDDERSHQALQTVAARTVEYAGLIETARLASIQDLSGADASLGRASAINRREISPEVQLIAERARERFGNQTSSGWYSAALILLSIGLLVLLAALYGLKRRFRRLINLPIALASIVVLAMLLLCVRGFLTQQQAFDDAEQEAFDAITVSQQLQESAYRHRSLATTSVLTNSAADGQLASIEEEIGGFDGLLQLAIDEGGSDRERAAAVEIRTRWERYQAESDRIKQALASGDVDRAELLTQGPANSAFNGFNTSVEAALLDNREQFLGQLEAASNGIKRLPGFIVLGSFVAVLLTWWGYAIRIGEYR